MQRFASALRLRAARPTPSLSVSLARNASTTSSPKAAEGASAESGGSRSKSAAEAAAVSSSSSPSSASDSNPGAMPDSLSDGDMRGRTGGGSPLEASHHAPRRPKVWNHAVASGRGQAPGEGLTEEQRAEVDEHNAEFDRKHDRANMSGDDKDKVGKGFWGGRDGGSKD